MERLKATPLLNEHQKLKAKMGSFSGWQVPLFYSSILEEYRHCRKSVVIFDVSHMGEITFVGDIKKSGIEAVVSCSLETIPIGKARYGFILNNQGGVIDDLVVLKLREDKLLFVVNAASQRVDYKILKEEVRQGKIEDNSSTTAKIDLQGPLARRVLAELFGFGHRLTYFSFSQYDYQGEKLLISRTGYTGELGYEIFLPNRLASLFWQKFLRHQDIKPAGFGARDILRIEMGYSLSGQELNQNITPLQAGLGRFVNFNKDFFGKTALLKQKNNGLDKVRVAFSTGSNKIPRFGYPIFSAAKKIGEVTSGTFSPFLASGIGLGYVEPGNWQNLEIEGQRQRRFAAKIAELPFYKQGSLKS